MERKRLTVFRAGGCWNVCWHGDAEVVRLFGSDVLPTPFTERAAADVVRARIAALNPEREVVLAESRP